jgi:hypothetical protein
MSFSRVHVEKPIWEIVDGAQVETLTGFARQTRSSPKVSERVQCVCTGGCARQRWSASARGTVMELH